MKEFHAREVHGGLHMRPPALVASGSRSVAR
jgi:hypothetical protein